MTIPRRSFRFVLLFLACSLLTLGVFLDAANARDDPDDSASSPESSNGHPDEAKSKLGEEPTKGEERAAASVPVDHGPALRVGVLVSPPFVFEEGDAYGGMAVALWEDIAKDLSRSSEYSEFVKYDALVDALASKQLDIAVTNLTITQDRAERIDLSQPWFDAGLRILIDRKGGAGLAGLIKGLHESGYTKAYAWLGGVVLLATFAFALFYRRFDDQFPRTWKEGIAESFYSVMSLITSGKSGRRNMFGWIGTILAALWLVSGVAVVAYVTSTVTSVMTTLQLRNQISDVSDLPGKRVGVLSGSVAARFAKEIGFATVPLADLDAAARALRGKRIDAFVGDSPTLEHYASTRPEAEVKVVGKIFHPDKYGFGLQFKSPLTKAVTVEILERHENGQILELKQKYFGRPGQ